MGKGNLALLSQAVAGAVAEELGEGTHDTAALAALGVIPQRHRMVAGLRVISNAARDAEVDTVSAERMDRLLRYRSDSELVTQKLERVGVKPLAVLPLSAWEHIADKAGLYRFQPKGDTVRVGNTDAILNLAWEKAREEARAEMKLNHTRLKQLLFKYLGVAAAIGSIPAGLYFGSFTAFGITAVCGFMSFGVSEFLGMPSDGSLRPKFKAHLKAFVDEQYQAGTLPKYLWPDMVESSKGAQVRISFPEPPEDVQKRLIAAERARLPLHIAIVPDAISFRENPVNAILKEQDARWAAERAASLSQDPIAYVVEGFAVAVIDQYGDFPIEREVINEVVNSEHLV